MSPGALLSQVPFPQTGRHGPQPLWLGCVQAVAADPRSLRLPPGRWPLGQAAQGTLTRVEVVQMRGRSTYVLSPSSKPQGTEVAVQAGPCTGPSRRAVASAWSGGSPREPLLSSQPALNWSPPPPAPHSPPGLQSSQQDSVLCLSCPGVRRSVGLGSELKGLHPDPAGRGGLAVAHLCGHAQPPLRRKRAARCCQQQALCPRHRLCLAVIVIHKGPGSGQASGACSRPTRGPASREPGPSAAEGRVAGSPSPPPPMQPRLRLLSADSSGCGQPIRR